MFDESAHYYEIERGMINVHEEFDIAYWSKEFGCTETTLIAAIMVAGTSIRSVRQYLGDH